jgi:hypothetical protein
MYGYIDGIDFNNEPTEKYWSFPKSYKGNKSEETKQMILSGEYIGSEKKDGWYARIIKDEDGNIILHGRDKSVDGTYHNKVEWVPQCQSFFDSLPNGTCLLGELYFPNQRGSRRITTILGCLKDKALERQSKGEKVCYYVFDVWAYNGKSLLNITMKDRIEKYLNKELVSFFVNQDYVHKAIYFEKEELWNELGKILSRGDEGIVITKKNSTPDPGKRPARKTLKIKMEIEQTIDAFIDGSYKQPTRLYTGKEIEIWEYWENVKTLEKVNKNMYFEYSRGGAWEPVTKNYFYGRAAALSFSVMKDGIPTHIGYISGITDEMRDAIVNNPERYKNKVFEISAMEIENIKGQYSLRHAKIIQERPDKNYEDCDWSQIAQ